jgi:hypothetical protein
MAGIIAVSRKVAAAITLQRGAEFFMSGVSVQ